ARLIGETKRTYLRLGYGFSRSRNGPVSMHAATSIAAVTGAWQHEGGGAFHANADIYKVNKTVIEGLDVRDPAVRVHEQFMTETAQMADVFLPATMFTEHDDIYRGGGHQYLILGPKLVEAPGECRSNHEVICALAQRVGAKHPGFEMSPRELIDQMLRVSNHGTFAEIEANRWIDCQPPFRASHYLDGFPWPDGKFRFKPDWHNVPFRSPYKTGPVEALPPLPDFWASIEQADEEHPFRLATSPSRGFLNSTFNETPTSLANEKRPNVMIHPED